MHQAFLSRLLFYFFCLLIAVNACSQTNLSWVCGDDKITALQKQLTPGYLEAQQRNILRFKEYIHRALQPKNGRASNRMYGSGPGDSIYTIPVVVHVIYPAGETYGTGTNISYAQIRSQLQALNAAYSRSYPDYNGQSHPTYAQNTKIQFCLARNSAPASEPWASGPGGIEYGVKRYPDNTGAYNHNMTVYSANQLLDITHSGQDYFPFNKYLNIWLVKTIDGGDNIMGYAPKPLTPGYPLDGIVMRADIFGDNTTGGNYALGFNLTQGKILAHEMGHYFNLYHIFQDGCAGANGPGAATDACDLYGDYVCDIKPCTTQNVLCNSGNYNTCKANYNTGTTSNDMINDYMSYADDDCMNTFTFNQAQRMWATLQLDRKNLWQAANLAATGVLGNEGCVPPYLNVSINTDEQVFCAGTPVHFSNPVAGNTAATRQWQFPGGMPSTAGTDTVTVIYNTPGIYTAILMVNDGTASRTDSLTINVLTCKLDSSLQFMAHWYFGNFCSLDFSSGAPVQTTTALDHNTMQGESAYPGQLPYVEGTISLSDSTGNLLFYSNGVSIWNKNHKKISTSSIFGASDINATTGICYIPLPGNSAKYFIAGVYPNFDGQSSGVRFISVDITTDNVSSYQEFNHSSLPSRFSQFLTVVPHCNGTDYWIITKGYGDDTRFFSFLVTAGGIDVNQAPVISTGFTHPGYGGSGDQMKANRNGDKLIIASPHGYVNIESAVLYDFDSRTGEVKNEKIIPNVDGYSNIQSGTAFSPNGEYFYLMRSTNFATNGTPHWLFQYRVSDLKYNIISTTGFYFGFPFQLGPDNQLYIVNGYNYLARLSNPDSWGGASFNDEFIYFKKPGETIFAGSSLPAFIDAKRKEPSHPDFSKQATDCQTFLFSSLCFDNYTSTWNFGDGSPAVTGSIISHTFTKAGDFNVTLTLSNSIKVFGSVTKKLTVLPLTISITGPDSVCSTNNFATQYFTQTASPVDYKWSVINGLVNGPDNLSFAGITWAKQNADSGKIQLQVSAGNNCVLNATKTVAILPGPVFNWPLKDSICITDAALVLSASPPGGSFSGPGVSNGIFMPDSAGPGNHQLTYRYINGTICNSEVQKTIKVTHNCIAVPIDSFPVNEPPKGLAMPGAFTPNGDGLNDLFRIPSGLITQLNEFIVYNRWGEKVFTTHNMAAGWNGNINGTPAGTGTYLYFISGTKTDGRMVLLKGTVVLIR